MTGWIIFGSIMLVLILILAQSVKVTVIYDKALEMKVKLLFITLYRIPAKPKKKKKKKTKKRKKDKSAKAGAVQTENASQADGEGAAENAEASGEADGKKTPAKEGKPKKEKMKLDPEMIMDYVRSASPPIKRLFKKIRIRNIYLDWVVGSGDAAKTAIKYGGICAAVYPIVEWMTTYLDTKVKEINIEADFDAEKDDIFFYGTMKLRISTALACAIWLLFRLAKTYLKYNKTETPPKKPTGKNGHRAAQHAVKRPVQRSGQRPAQRPVQNSKQRPVRAE